MAKVERYTSTFCGYCFAAERLLKKKGVDFVEINIGGSRQQRDEMLARSEGRYTVPQIFIDGLAVGGYDDIAALDRRGELDPLLFGQAGS